MNKHILITGNNDAYEEFLHKLLLDNGYEVTSIKSSIEVINNIHTINPDLVISGFELPSIDGESFFTALEKEIKSLPVIFISDTRDEDLITSMLQYTNCEFMVKPVVTAELLSRIKVLLTPNKEISENGDELVVNDLKLNLKSKRAFLKNKTIVLTPTEYKVLEYLMANKNTVLSRDSILNKVWGTTKDVSDRIIDVYIGYLRDKLTTEPETKIIETIPGFGYTIRD